MFIRFVTGEIDPQSGRRRGVFHAGNTLMESGNLSAKDAEALQAAFDWFNANLPHPTRFSLSARPNRKAQALSWFKPSAIDHISRMWSYIHVLNANGLMTEVLKTRRPGYVVYQDGCQVVAYPFADTPS